MKKIIKSIPVYLTVVMLLCSLLIVPAFASSGEQIIEPFEILPNDVWSPAGDIHYVVGAFGSYYFLSPGTYSFSYGSFDGERPEGFDSSWIVFDADFLEFSGQAIPYSSDCVFTVTDEMICNDPSEVDFYGYCMVFINSYGVEPSVSVYVPPVVDVPSDETPVVSILGVWAKILAWMADAFDRLTLVFYSADTGLTFIGYLAVGALSVAVVFLLLGLVRKWLRFGR